jgi:amidase
LSYGTFDQSLTTLGSIARYVEDLVTILPIISGNDGIDPFAFDVPIGDYLDTDIAGLSFAFYADNGLAAPISPIDNAVRRVASSTRLQAYRPGSLASFSRNGMPARAGMTRFFTDYDVILCPVSAVPAPIHDVDMKELEATMLSYTAIYNSTGWPAAVVRIGTSEDGLPIGIQIVDKPWRESVVLAVAKFVEQEFAGFVAPAI